MATQNMRGELDERPRNILRALIQEHVRTGKPIGSRRLANTCREGVSPATIRNVMADLEEMGFLTQPHMSAGRVPTDKGYRFYVDSLLQARGLSTKEANEIKTSLEKEADPGQLMNKTSRLLSALSHNVGFVLAPPLSLAVMKRIEFVKISDQRILVILVTAAGIVQHRLIYLKERLTQADLDEASRYLVAQFEGRDLNQIRDELLHLMSEEKSLYDRMLRNVVLLGSAGLMKEKVDSSSESRVYLGGTTQIMLKPELADVNRMIALFQTFEEKSWLVKIITECLKEDQLGPTVKIGLEKHIPDMRDWALISSPYLYNQQVMGGLGILGPSRMEYEKAISLVDYVAKLFGKILSNNN